MGLEAFKQFLTDFKKPTTLIVSVGGESPEDFATIVEELNTYDLIDAFELNLSCPNVKREEKWSARITLPYPTYWKHP